LSPSRKTSGLSAFGQRLSQVLRPLISVFCLMTCIAGEPVLLGHNQISTLNLLELYWTDNLDISETFDKAKRSSRDQD